MEVGRPLNVKTPEEMWSLFENYVSELKKKPFKVKDYVGKDGIEVEREKEKPLTLEGFYNYCRRKVGEVHQYFENKDSYKDFLGICRAIRSEIRQNQIEGGMANMFNPSITQRLNGLTEKSEHTIIEQPLFPDGKKED